MSFANPTALRIGMVGNLVGKRYRVAGRMVMGMDDGGQTYYWNEFNLVNTEGESATLVYEETERGGEWRVFTLFEPQSPMTVQEAAAKRIGDTVNLEGRPIPVTLVDESRVYQIEGEAPEGVEFGDVAHYFNAGADNQMTVVSWTGDEIEFYRGLNLPRGTVESAFNLRPVLSGSAVSSEERTYSARSGFIVKIVIGFLGLVIFFASYASCRSARPRNAVVKTNAPASPLTVGNDGQLDGKTYRIRGHAVVEIAQVGRIHERHEYPLFDDAGNRALLVYGSKPGARDWLLFTPVQPPNPLTPHQAAAFRLGEVVSLDRVSAPIDQLFQSTVRQKESVDLPDLETGIVLYGFSARSGATYLLARWNDNGITFHRGKSVPGNEVISAFSQSTPAK